jgi:NADH:ubiquinone oxidoreductase subunit C
VTGWLPAPAEEIFGTGASAEEAYGLLTADVPAAAWTAALDTARRVLGCTYFDWLSAVDEPGTGYRVCAHVVALAPVRRLLLRTTVPHESPVLASAVGVYAGADWHERETHEMFGVRFDGHPGLAPLLLPDTFEGHPLRKDFVLAARVAKAWPGAKEPGESGHGAPKRRQMLPPGVPDPNEWGPLKGQLPDAPARPARRTRTATGEGAAPRRTRSAAEGSASQDAASQDAASRGSASQGAASQGAERAAPRRARTPSGGSASQREAAPGSADAPWHHARPAFDEDAERTDGSGEAPRGETPRTTGETPDTGPAPDTASAPTPAPDTAPAPETDSDPAPRTPPGPGQEPPEKTPPPGGEPA